MYYQSEKMTIDKLPDEPIVVLHFSSQFDFGKDMDAEVVPAFTLLDSLETPVYWILDLTEARMGLDQLIGSVNQVTRGQRPLWKHLMIRQVIGVTESHLLQLAAKGLNSEIFGNLNAPVFGSVGEAVEYARSAQQA